MGWEHPSNQKRRRLQCRKGSLCLASRSLGRTTLINSGKHWFNWHHVLQPCKDNNPIKYDFRTVQVNCINNPIYPLILCRLCPLCLMQTSHETKFPAFEVGTTSVKRRSPGKKRPLKRLSAACHVTIVTMMQIHWDVQTIPWCSFIWTLSTWQYSECCKSICSKPEGKSDGSLTTKTGKRGGLEGLGAVIGVKLKISDINRVCPCMFSIMTIQS